jgi:GT2 family glycosyltransferase
MISETFETISGCVSIVIVTWNSAGTLAACLESIQEQTYPSIEVVVVDNASSDQSVELVRENFPGAKVIRNDANLGFCQGQNIGIHATSGEYVMPLNPDITMTPTYIAEMVRAINRDPSIGIVAGKLYLPELHPPSGARLLDGTGLFVNRARRQYLRGHGEPDHGQYNQAGFIFGACGAAPLYRRKMLDEIQVEGEYFDQTFFAHKEDFDLSWRAQLSGWKAWYQPAAVAFHPRSFRPSRRATMAAEIKVHAVKNRYLAIIKNDLLPNLLRDLAPLLWYDLKIIGFILFFERSSLKGILLFFSLLPIAFRRRRIIMKRRVTSSHYFREFYDPR